MVDINIMENIQIKMKNGRKRILILMWKDGIGGPERSLRDLLTVFDKDKYNILILYLGGSKGVFSSEIEKMGYKVEYLKWCSGYSVMGRFKLLKKIYDFKPLIIHEHTLPPLTGIFIKLFYKNCKLIHTEHGPALLHSSGHDRLHKYLFTMEYFFYDLLIANSNVSEKALMAAYKIPNKKIKKVYLGIDFSKYKKTTRIKKINENYNIGYLGRIYNKHKGTDFLPLIARKLLDKGYHNFRFIIGGDGPDKKNIEFLCDELKVGHLFKFLGWVYDIQGFFNEIDILLAPSRFESFCISVLESISTGVKVVGFNIGGLSECFSKFPIVKLVPFGDIEAFSESIIFFINNPDTDYDYENSTKLIKKEFSIFDTSKKIQEIYDGLV